MNITYKINGATKDFDLYLATSGSLVDEIVDFAGIEDVPASIDTVAKLADYITIELVSYTNLPKNAINDLEISGEGWDFIDFVSNSDFDNEKTIAAIVAIDNGILQVDEIDKLEECYCGQWDSAADFVENSPEFEHFWDELPKDYHNLIDLDKLARESLYSYSKVNNHYFRDC